LLGYDRVREKRFGSPGKVLEFFASKSGNPVSTVLSWIWTLDLDIFGNLAGTSLPRMHLIRSSFMKMRLFLSEIGVKLWKNAQSCSVEESRQKFLYPDSEADDFQYNQFFLLVTSEVEFLLVKYCFVI